MTNTIEQSYVLMMHNDGGEWWHPVATYDDRELARSMANELSGRLPDSVGVSFTVETVQRSPIFAITGKTLTFITDLDTDDPCPVYPDDGDLGLDSPSHPTRLKEIFSDKAIVGYLDDRDDVVILASKDDDAIERAVAIWREAHRDEDHKDGI